MPDLSWYPAAAALTPPRDRNSQSFPSSITPDPLNPPKHPHIHLYHASGITPNPFSFSYQPDWTPSFLGAVSTVSLTHTRGRTTLTIIILTTYHSIYSWKVFAIRCQTIIPCRVRRGLKDGNARMMTREICYRDIFVKWRLFRGFGRDHLTRILVRSFFFVEIDWDIDFKFGANSFMCTFYLRKEKF